ncbi:MAG: rhodanese-like domain-containing protein [Desulfobacteraceae bacterium]|jgi:thiosulfate/3-mercaptopyruvate sulfurtransferase
MKKIESVNIVFIICLTILSAGLLACDATGCDCPDIGNGERTIDPIVTTDWLSENLTTEGLVILDVRYQDDYDQGHIPGSVNEPCESPYSAWLTMRDDLLLEIPDEADLFDTLGNLGIQADSKVVIVTAPNDGEIAHYGLANATRVASTLFYAGIVDVAILDGGYSKWEAENREISTAITTAEAVTYDGNVYDDVLVSTEYVKNHLSSAILIDARDTDVYFGITLEFWANNKLGHINGAASLPTPWIWDNVEGSVYTYKGDDTLLTMARNIAGTPSNQEIIVYCGVGGYASSWWYVLTQILGYTNVKFYDGGIQEWALYYNTVSYKWQL